MKKYAWVILLGFILVCVADCVVGGPSFAPPPAKKELLPAKPGPNFVWISGHWKWTANDYSWVSGHWVKTLPGNVWVPGHWAKKGPRWVWIKGRWRKR